MLVRFPILLSLPNVSPLPLQRQRLVSPRMSRYPPYQLVSGMKINTVEKMMASHQQVLLLHWFPLLLLDTTTDPEAKQLLQSNRRELLPRGRLLPKSSWVSWESYHIFVKICSMILLMISWAFSITLRADHWCLWYSLCWLRFSRSSFNINYVSSDAACYDDKGFTSDFCSRKSRLPTWTITIMLPYLFLMLKLRLSESPIHFSEAAFE